MKTRRCLALAFVTVLSALPGLADTPIAQGTNFGFSLSQTDSACRRAVGSRTRTTGCPLTCSAQGDLVLIDWKAAATPGFILEFAPGGRTVTLSLDGSRVAWQTVSPTQIWTADTQFATTTELTPAEPTSATLGLLDLNMTGSWLAYSRTDDGTIRRRQTSGGSPEIVDTGTIGLNSHCVTTDGTVYYTKKLSGEPYYHVWKRGPFPASAVQQTSGVTSEERQVVVTPDGSQRVHVSWDATTGRTDAFATGTVVAQLTSSTSASWRIERLDVTSNRQFATFVSNGDWTGGNADGSDEIFKVSVSTTPVISQLTSRTDPDPLQAPKMRIASFGMNGDVSQWAYTPWMRSDPLLVYDNELNMRTIRYHAVPYTNPLLDAATATDLITPPYDVVAAGTPASGLGCRTRRDYAPPLYDGIPDGAVRCRVTIRAPSSGGRNVVLAPEFVMNPGCGSFTWRPIERTLVASRQLTYEFTQAAACPFPVSGTFSLLAWSPDVEQADRVSVALSYLFP